MKYITIALLLFPSMALSNPEKVKIKLNKENLHGKGPKDLSLCSPVGATTRNALIKRYLDANKLVKKYRDTTYIATGASNKYMKMINNLIKKKKHRGFFNSKLFKKNRIYEDKLNKNSDKYNTLWAKIEKIKELNIKAYEILLRTTAKGRPSLYGLKVAVEEMERFISSGDANTLSALKIKRTNIIREMYKIYKKDYELELAHNAKQPKTRQVASQKKTPSVLKKRRHGTHKEKLKTALEEGKRNRRQQLYNCYKYYSKDNCDFLYKDVL